MLYYGFRFRRNGRSPFPAVAKREKIRINLPMPMTVEHVLAETSRWPSEQVEKLFESLLMSNYHLPDPAVDTAWAEEIKRRIDDIESGRELGVPGEEVMARVRKIVGL
jgi:putative addiction module component (TIGR02574 family)